MGDENQDQRFLKKLGEDKIFKFECAFENDKIKLSLKEIKNNSPDYYEVCYTLEELYIKNNIFKAYNNLDKIRSNLKGLFTLKTTTLESLENGAKIKLHIEAMMFADHVDLDFILDKK